MSQSSASDDVSSDSEPDSDDSLFGSESDEDQNNSNDSMNENPEQYQYFYRYPRMVDAPHLGYNIEGPIDIDLLLQLMLDDEIDVNTYEIRQKRFCECEWCSQMIGGTIPMKYIYYDQSYTHLTRFFSWKLLFCPCFLCWFFFLFQLQKGQKINDPETFPNSYLIEAERRRAFS